MSDHCSVHLFCSLRSNAVTNVDFEVSKRGARHTWHEEYSSSCDVCAPLLTQSLRSKACDSVRTIMRTPLPCDVGSHGKGIFLIIVLCTSFAHFEAKLATRSADPTSHGKGIFLSHCSVHLFCSLRSKACDSVS